MNLHVIVELEGTGSKSLKEEDLIKGWKISIDDRGCHSTML